MNNVFLLLSQRQSIKIRDTVVQRQQISLITKYCVTEYKTQKSIYFNAVLNLQWQRSSQRIRKKMESSHQHFYSVYVQLSCLCTLNELCLLEPITFENLIIKSQKNLMNIMMCLKQLKKFTIFK